MALTRYTVNVINTQCRVGGRSRNTEPASQVEASRRLGISLNRLNEIVLGKRGITADTALRLSRLLKTSPQLWMRLQADWDLHQAMIREREAS
jgi:addiction module HigA family antidote